MARLLYIEDNELNRNMLSRRLNLEGYEVLLAATSHDGIEMAATTGPDLILMDPNLSTADGWETAREIKSKPETQHIPLIALTAHAMAGDRERALDAGCDDYDTKPVKIDRLLPKIRTLLGEEADESGGSTPNPQPPASADAPERRELDRGHLLVVDDNENNRNLLSRRLNLEGYRVSVAEDGRKALERIATESHDLILLDIMMPVVNGLQVLEEIRKEHALTDLPVIMVTAKDRSEDIVQALEGGANDYVTKPIDITVLLARIRTQLSLRGLARLKDEFLAMASHDLKTPLTALLGFARLIQEQVPPGTGMNEQYYGFLERIVENARVMQRIVTDFLDFNALEEGRLKLQLEPTDLNEVIRRVLENNHAYAGEKEIAVEDRLDEDLGEVDGDRARLEQIVQNLVSNALKFTPKGGVVSVRSRVEDGSAFVEVSDTGKGLTDEDMKKVFARYQQLSAKPTGGEKSSGLGLCISKSLVEAHSGEIGVRNNPEKGATFWFRIPIEMAPKDG